MKTYKILLLLIAALLLRNITEAQGLFSIRGSRGDRSNSIIESRIEEKKITDLNSFKDYSGVSSEQQIMYRGLTVYNPEDYSSVNTKIAKGFYTWDGAKWGETYASSLTGSLKGDLETLYVMQNHPENSRYINAKGFHKWDIDLENIDNPKNLKLNGVFFKQINGEQRVIDVKLEDFYYQNITVTKGLEAVMVFTIRYNDNLKNINLNLPNLINYFSEENESLVKTDLNCKNLEYAQSRKNRKESIINISNCPKLFSMTIYETRVTDLDVSKNKELTYLLCYSNALSSLNISQNTKLYRLICHTNSLTTLDVSKNIALKYIYCSKNKITTLDVSKNPELQVLECSLNLLKELDVSNNKKLTELMCNYNYLLEILDLSSNTDLKILECSVNRSLKSLNISSCLMLNRLMVAETKLTSLDLSSFTKLNTLDIYNSSLISIPKSIKICRHSFEKIYANSYNVHEKNIDIYDLVNCD